MNLKLFILGFGLSTLLAAVPCEIYFSRLSTNRKFSAAIGSEITVKLPNGENHQGVFMGKSKKGLIYIALSPGGQIIRLPPGEVDLKTVHGTQIDPDSVERQPRYRTQTGPECTGKALSNCLTYLNDSGISINPDIRAALEEIQNERYLKPVTYLQRKWVALKSILTLKAQGPTIQLKKQIEVLNKNGLSGKVTEDPESLRAHVSSGKVALLNVLVDQKDYSDVYHDSKNQRVEAQSNHSPISISSHQEIKNLNVELGGHSVLVLGYANGLYVVLDSNHLDLRIWKEEDVREGLKGGRLPLGPFVYRIPSAAILVGEQ